VVFVTKIEKQRMKGIISVFLLILFLIPVSSCFRVEQLPPEPTISFNSFQIFDTTDLLDNKVKGGRLNFSFVDGDGDLGLEAPSDMTFTDTTNLFFILYRKTGGVFKPAPSNDPLNPSSYRIPYMDRQGQNKILRGNITVTFLYLFATPKDTIMYRFYVKDRADHVSDTVKTCEITFGQNYSCKY
jgi:hypothetical protein